VPDSRVESLIEKALAEAWLPTRDLDWSAEVSLDSLRTPEALCSVSDVPAYRKMSARARDEYRLKETAWALSNLIFGEKRGALLSAQVIVDSIDEQSAADAQFLGVLVVEEARHFEALERYVGEKIRITYPPHSAMVELFRGLQTHRLWQLKLIVGQILFEPTACSMLHSLLVRSEEPLLFEIIRRILRDEARHLAYSYDVAGDLVRRVRGSEKTEAEDLIFESVVSCLAAFLPEGPWSEAQLDAGVCRKAAVEALAKRGVLQHFTSALPTQLARHGFPSERLRDLIEHDLAKKLLGEGGAVA
jgi:hypothetical protein